MKTKIAFRLVLAAGLLWVSLSLNACNTIRGAGRDVENVGATVAKTPGP